MGRRSDQHFEQLMNASISALRAYARSVTANSWLADEAVQETLIRAWRYWPTFRGDSSALTWLITICRRVVIDLASRTQHHEQFNNDVENHSHIANPDNSNASGIHDLISELPLPLREVVVLCLILGFSYEETARLLEIPIGTVRSRLSRARETLASQLHSEFRQAQ